MYYKINNMESTLDDKQGYAFVDCNGHTIIVTYGDTNKGIVAKFLEK